MHAPGSLHWTTWAGAFFAALGFLVACDVPTSGPSLETETTVNAPVVIEKTFSFLGGPASEHEPLIDTTTSTFDSLFVVDASDQTLSIEEEVSSFEVGSLDRALDEAAEGLDTRTTLSESAVQQNSDLATQSIDGRFQRRTGVPPPTPGASTTTPVPPGGERPFPSDLLEVPDFDLVTAENATVQQALLTDETTVDGTTVNRFAFTLTNNDASSAPLTDGTGGPPVVEIRDPQGVLVAGGTFPQPVAPGTSEQVAVDMAGKRFGENSTLVLTVNGNGPEDEITTAVSPLRYQELTLDGVDQVGVRASATDLSARDEQDASQFAGIAVRSGTLQLTVTNELAFPIAVDTLRLANNAGRLEVLPSDFPALALEERTGRIDPGQTATITADLEGRGLARGIDVTLVGRSAQTGQTVTISADGGVTTAAQGPLTIGAMYFWPDGEQVRAGGRFSIDPARIRFDRSDDFVDLQSGTLRLKDFVSEARLGFESLALTFPDLRQSPFRPSDSLSLTFTEQPGGQFEFPAIGANDGPRDVEANLSDLRLLPTGNVVDYHVQGTLERVDSQTQSTLRVLRFEDVVRTDVIVDQLEVRALKASVDPFSVNLTEDTNGDGRLDLADPAEARRADFDDLDGIADNVDGPQLRGSTLKFRVRTDAGTDARLYAALRGRGGTAPSFLAGTGDRAVSAAAPLGDDFYEGSSQIARQNLIQFGIEGAPASEPVTRSVRLTGETSTVDEVISTLPSALDLVAQARLTGDADDRIRLQRPLTFETGLSVSVPLRFEGTFQVRDTVDADFSSLDEVVDPAQDASLSTAELTVSYENEVPVGTDLDLTILDERGTEVLSVPGADDPIRLAPAPTGEDGTANGTQSGTTTVTLDQDELRRLAEGRRIVLRFALEAPSGDAPATVRATDPVRLSLRTNVEASINPD